MKKTLFLSAILGAALCSSAMGADATITYYDAYAIAPGDGSVITFSGDTKGDVTLAATNNKDNIVTTLKAAEATALLEDGGKRFILRSDAAVANAGTIIIAAGKYNNTDTTSAPDHAYTAGQLFVDASGGSAVTMRLKNDLVLGVSAYTESSWGNNYGGAMRLSSDRNKRIELSGAVTLVDNAQIAVGGQFNTITGAVNGAGKTLTLTLDGKLNFTGSTTLGTLSSNNNTLLFGSAGTTTSIGALTGTAKGLTTEATTTIGSGLSLNGTLANGGSLSVDGDIAVNTDAAIANFTVKGINASTADSQSGIASTASADYYAIRNVGTLNLNGHNVTGTGVTQSGTDYVFSKDLAADSTYVVYGATGSKSKADLNATNLLMTSGSSLSISTGGNNTAFVRGIVDIRSGATLTLAHNDALSWSGANPTQLILLTGEDADHKATLALTATQTLSTNLELRGHSAVTGSTFNTYEGNITATGTDNTISSNINLRRHMDVMVLGTDSTLTLSGAIGYHNDGTADSGVQLTKLGSGTLTISGNITTGGVIAGAGSTIITSQTISGSHTGDTSKNQTLTLREVTMGRNSTQTLTGNVVLDGVTLKNRLDVRGTVTLQNGATDNHTNANEYAMVIGWSGSTGNTLTFTSGDYDLTKHNKSLAVYKDNTLVVGDGADVKVKSVFFAESLGDNGTLTVNNGGKLTIVSGGTSATHLGAMNANGVVSVANNLKSNTFLHVEGSYSQTAGTATISQQVELANGGSLTLSGTASMIAGTYLNMAGNTSLELQDTSSLSVNGADPNRAIWMQNGDSITMAAGATISLSGTAFNMQLKGGTITADGGVQIGGAKTDSVSHGFISDSAITVNKGDLREYNITGGSVTIADNLSTQIKSSLSDTTALVLGSGSTVSFATDTEAKSVSGAAATVTLNHNLAVAGNVTIGTLTLSGGADITAETIIGEHNGTITLSGLTVTDNDSKMNGNLVMAGGKLIFANNTTLTMGCSVTIGADGLVTVELTDEMVSTIAGGGRVDLFTDVEGAQLINGNIVFTGVDGATLDKANVYSLQYDATTKTIYAAPEPATATLSLLALAALCARRRRH